MSYDYYVEDKHLGIVIGVYLDGQTGEWVAITEDANHKARKHVFQKRYEAVRFRYEWELSVKHPYRMMLEENEIRKFERRRLPLNKRFAPNRYEISGDTAYIYDCTDEEEKLIAVIDSEDVERCQENIWYVSDKYGHVSGEKGTSLHRFIMKEQLERTHLNSGENLVVDHVDRDPSNNKKCNLRLVPSCINTWNRKPGCSGTVGVCEEPPHSGIWIAYMSHKGKTFSQRFDNKKDAIKQRKQWEQSVSKSYKYNHGE